MTSMWAKMLNYILVNMQLNYLICNQIGVKTNLDLIFNVILAPDYFNPEKYIKIRSRRLELVPNFNTSGALLCPKKAGK